MPATNLQATPFVVYVNGKKVVDNDLNPSWTLLQYLRNKLRLCGTKLGCGEGGCGACTVMVSRYNRTRKKVMHMTVNACLTPAASVHGLSVTTVEGIGSTRTQIHPVQERIAKSHGSQCGFCTPGIVMSMYTLLRNRPQPSLKEVEDNLQGNLCRCTGYRPILEGFKTLTQEGGCCGGSVNGCCKNNEQDEDVSSHLFNPSEFAPYDPSQEPIFPPELKMSDECDRQSAVFRGQDVTWYRPQTLNELLDLKEKYSEAKLTVGNTEVGIEVKFKHFQYPILVAPTSVPELNTVQINEDGITLGACVTLTKIEEILREVVEKQIECKTRFFSAILEMLHWFAGKQIRNVACLGGNIITASPISDLNPLLMASGALLHLATKAERRTILIDQSFFTGYRKTALKPTEILVSVTIPFSKQNEYFFGFKQAQRRDDDIAIVNAGMRVVLQEGSHIIDELSLAFGGMAPTTIMAARTMTSLKGRRWEDSVVEDACRFLAEDLPLTINSPGGMVAYRCTLANSFFFKFYHKVVNQILVAKGRHGTKMADTSVYPEFHRDLPKGSQFYQVAAPGQMKEDPIGRPVPAHSAVLQATGEAVYCDDMPFISGELYLGLVLSTRPYARLVQVDPSAALAMDGVVCFLSEKDLPGERNVFGHGGHIDEEVFASTEVTSHGAVIAAVVANDQATAQKAARAVRIKYEDLQPLILTIQDAIQNESYFNALTNSLTKGDPEGVLLQSDLILEGEMHVGGQEHFYLETNCALVIPKGEHEEIEVFASTQNPTLTQQQVASALGVPENRVVCKLKRIGGGFGGKETRSVLLSVVAAVAAKKTNRPIRCMLDRDEDMAIMGTRHPFLATYKVGFNREGQIEALVIDLYSNGGNSVDLSAGVMNRALLHIDNVYRIPHVRATGRVCKTNLPSNTAFRGFGAPQGMLFTESWINDIATTLQKDPQEVRALNLYHEGDLTPFNQVLNNCTISRCWQECLTKSDYQARREAVQVFNSESRWKKRGIAIVPTKFGIAFGLPFMNQAGALVHIYTDGSVLLTHSGVEMGQGLNTKMIQVASRALRLPASKIHLSEVSTDKVPNTSPTAASVSSDLNGMAIMNACQVLLQRLEPFMAANPKGSWEDWVNAAYMARVSLSATGFYKVPDLGYNFKTNSGRPFNYFTFGVACSEVEMDCLTGDQQVLRTDIVMDVGDSLNPAIDIGQIEGAFMQGYGLFTMEELKYSPNGFLYTRGPGTYKIPSFSDIPVEFNVALLKNAANKLAVYSSKAVGEPPLFLAASVFFAIKDAITSARRDAGIEGIFRMDSPATPARIRLACADAFANQFSHLESSSEKGWSIVV